MLPTEPTGLRALKSLEPARPATPVGDPRQEAFHRLNQIEIGKFLQAEVLSRFKDGTYLLKIAETTVQAALPKEAQVGKFLNLKMLASQPRPTFLLAQSPTSDTATLSLAGRLIGNALHTAQQDAGPVTIVAKAAMLAAPSIDTPEVAEALRHTVSSSGLFYESHLNEWVKGSRSLADIQQEPQAKLKAEGAQPTGMKPETGLHAATPRIEIVDEWNEGISSKLSASVSTAVATELIRNETAQLINLQLHALEQQKFMWQGELWPGQRLEWEIQEEENHAHQDGKEGESRSSWSSTVRFELPSLGMVAASIYLEGSHVQMQIKAAKQETTALLRLHGKDLADALDAAGSPLDALTVKQDEQA
jgi:hypothetical protein